MSETVKTSIFAAVALVLALGAFGSVYLTQPSADTIEKDLGQPMFPDFKDPLKGANLEIVAADKDLATVRKFEVEQGKSGEWVIPSHGGYPADAENRIRDAAAALNKLKILGVATDRAGDHELFGVIEPTTENAGKEGVGTLISLRDSGGKDLVRLIVGQKVKGQDKQRFVRRPNQDRVYAVEISLDAFPSKFEDWIEKDLLKLNPLDLKTLTINDYSTQAAVDRQGFLRAKDNRRMDLTVTNDNGKWKLDGFTLYRNNKPQTTSLLPEEELNETKLNDLKNGLDELKIVDVRRKPEGLGADLMADKGFLENEEGLRSLLELGFIPDASRTDAQKVELYAANGEVIASLKNGVEYVLKYGNVSGAEEESDSSKLNRYLLVMARVNYDAIPKPDLAELPPLAEGPAPPSEPAAQEPAKESSCGAQEEEKKDDAAANDPAKTPAAPNAPADKKPADDKAKIEAERERITKENQRKQDEYNDKKKEAEKQVRELTYRFSPWYYIVSEDEFKKVRLTRNDVIKEKASVEEEGTGIDAFRKLEEEGLKKKEPAKTPGGFEP